ncbi:hypothetical protein DSO57_1038071 [Entomophthora muscae]|uniref:Uncharacterized protein n=1 Tax=Entomophthora muscae TaxID=34485 RepID=A0ACC2S0X0_9FUNG|nr:hypothetical protein DSO57_1038071 [Entomophthora muscae]
MLPYFVFVIYQFSKRSPSSPVLLPADSCPPDVPFGPIYFTEYPLKPKYKEYTPERILELDPLVHIKSAVRYSCQGPWASSTTFLTAYKLDMELPVTPKPMPVSLPDLPTDHTSKVFGFVYITLTGMIYPIIPAAGLWSWVGKSFSDLFKFSPLLWWALPAKSLAGIIPENDKLAAQAWIPDSLLLQKLPVIRLELIRLKTLPTLTHCWRLTRMNRNVGYSTIFLILGLFLYPGLLKL